MAMTEEEKLRLAAKIMMQGVREPDAKAAVEAILLFRTIKAYTWQNLEISDSAAATLAAAVYTARHTLS